MRLNTPRLSRCLRTARIGGANPPGVRESWASLRTMQPSACFPTGCRTYHHVLPDVPASHLSTCLRRRGNFRILLISTILTIARDHPIERVSFPGMAENRQEYVRRLLKGKILIFLVKGPVCLWRSQGNTPQTTMQKGLATNHQHQQPDKYLSRADDRSQLSGCEATPNALNVSCQVVHMSMNRALRTSANRMSTEPESHLDARCSRSCSIRSISAFNFGSAAAFSSMVRTACITVVWSRPPK